MRLAARVALLLILLPAAGACGPDWGSPSDIRIPVGRQKVEAAALCSALGAFASRGQLAAAANLPHDLPPVLASMADYPWGYEKRVAEVFRSRGYVPLPEQSGPGVIAFGKRLASNATLVVSLDVGSRRFSASGLAFVSIGDRYAAFEMPAAPRHPIWQYTIVDDATWIAVLENYAASAEVLERTARECPGVRPDA